ncbi:MAG: hypothetical protein IT235_00765 [Bacteroidia bacterium]|nr:hypothetical protein [Bacteroidia bacterium]
MGKIISIILLFGVGVYVLPLNDAYSLYSKVFIEDTICEDFHDDGDVADDNDNTFYPTSLCHKKEFSTIEAPFLFHPYLLTIIKGCSEIIVPPPNKA